MAEFGWVFCMLGLAYHVWRYSKVPREDKLKITVTRRDETLRATGELELYSQLERAVMAEMLINAARDILDGKLKY